MTLAEAIYELVKSAHYRGFVDDNSRESFEKIEWNDDRPKPQWEDVVKKMAEDPPESADPKLVELIDRRVQIALAARANAPAP